MDLAEIEALLERSDPSDYDSGGNPRYLGFIRGIRVRIVVALDDPDLIVTIHERRR